ncbi:unnamed protein product [Paramecium pentaurelia]|uniref:WD repeat-containing protein 92 n=1 Tax=Paramecium pentaurelia TaxID=43138 RepID=A0A8S1T4Q1_9CILI|nr:unnamed protein product [Paramecium pentaurelia]
MDTTNAPQIIEHLNKSLNFTPFVTRWIPGTAKFVLCGQPPKANGIIEILQLNKTELKTLSSIEQPKGIKCGQFLDNLFAFGDFDGKLKVIDLETKKTTFEVKAHDQIINSIDTCFNIGAPEIVTGSRDGCVRVWDPRQAAPVVSLEPIEKDVIPDAWSVVFGNSYNDERVIACGYDNGDIKLFDLKQNQLIWDTNVKNGICGIEFDRKDIQMNKLVATTLESKINVFDLRTFNNGFASLTHEGQKSTIWGVKHLPQNRDLFATQGGDGALNIYKYSYPSQRQIQDTEGKPKGVIGKLELLNKQDVCQQPISSLDWNTDKLGLACLCGLDQTCKVVIVTKLNLF